MDKPQRTVFLLEHVHVLPSGEKDVKLIGIYSSPDAAHAAIERVKVQPGFRDYPRLIDPLADDERSGFLLEEYEIDKDHWTEGFITIP